MKNLRINKILFFILFFVFILFLNNKCFASTQKYFTYNDYKIAIPFEIEEDTYFLFGDYNSVGVNFLVLDDETAYFYTSASMLMCNKKNLEIRRYNLTFIEGKENYSLEDWETTIHTTRASDGAVRPISSVYYCSYIYGDSRTISSTKFSDRYLITEETLMNYETPTLYIDDMNFRKRFKFQFNIPIIRNDTKYYVFLEDYNRISYDSVSATFRIYTVTTPEGYDYTDYENYMYYDNLDKKLYLPAGCEIKEYSCTGTNNTTLELSLENEFTGERDNKFFYESETLRENILVNINTSFSQLSNNSLIPTNTLLVDYNPREVVFSLLKPLATFYNKTLGNFLKEINFENEQDYIYKELLHNFYYNKNTLNYNLKDLSFSSYSIVSYENEKISSNTLKDSTFYNFFRKTKIYNRENMINSLTYSFQYTDSEDVSSMLPEGTNIEYLTSPFYKDNENSSSGGYITYDINEILQGNKVIDYSKEDNSIHNNFNGDYIENFEEGDNIVINNYYTTTIEKTSDSNLLHNIYLAILELKLNLSNIGSTISNTTNNFTYNTENTVKYYFVPNSYAMDSIKEDLENAVNEHLGIIAEPFHRYTIYFYSIFWHYCK